ncbi:uncharacterized protein LOC116347716 [Contarinia nasturtii]|uniref:uncharacterized protein LOC116347716 n=1 Tax=Contarinia nasturtii TaxID=265458 RepID=UPI0012D48222|nr:uncharacterized protein LOC116347716 [Contarinia nasturtii]
MSDLKKLTAELDCELESILTNSDGSDEVTIYLRNYLRYSLLRRYLKWLLCISIVIAILCASIYYIPFLNWNASAIGRLALIKLVLPYYDWQHLYRSRCLIEQAKEDKFTYKDEAKGYYEFNKDKCAICEKLSGIDRISSTTYATLQSVYLSRDNPVIIDDSHAVWPNQPDVSENFIEFLFDLPDLRNSIPCNIGTNLLQVRSGNSPKLQHLLRQMSKIDSKGWFLHFRNCDFDAVKSSRLIFPLKHRPYFISSHLPPFHTSWILLSKHYNISTEKHLPVKDLVIVLQMSGTLSGRLTVRRDCKEICSDQMLKLNAGESLVFNAQMWDFYYIHNINSHANLTITTIHEIQID